MPAGSGIGSQFSADLKAHLANSTECAPSQIRALASCTVRSRPSLDSRPIGILLQGQVVRCTAAREDPKAAVRLRCAQGWVSLYSASNGQQLLAVVGEVQASSAQSPAQPQQAAATAAKADYATTATATAETTAVAAAIDEDASQPGSPLESPSDFRNSGQSPRLDLHTKTAAVARPAPLSLTSERAATVAAPGGNSSRESYLASSKSAQVIWPPPGSDLEAVCSMPLVACFAGSTDVAPVDSRAL